MGETVKCYRCKKEVPVTEITRHNIIYQSSRQVYDSWKKRMVYKKYVASEMLDFCSEQCALNEQMSREG